MAIYVCAIFSFSAIAIYSWTIEQIDRDIVYYNLCGIGSQHSNISKGKKRGGGCTYKKSLVCKTPIVKVDRNKNVTLNRFP